MNEERILQWAEYEFKTNKEVIEDVSAQQVRSLLEENDYVMVFLCKWGKLIRGQTSIQGVPADTGPWLCH